MRASAKLLPRSRRICLAFSRAAAAFLLCGLIGGPGNVLRAQQQSLPARTITVRMLDSKTGLLIETTHFLVQADHSSEIHGDWITKNEDGTGKLTVPEPVQLISVRATYEFATETYVNCDVNKVHPSADHAANPLRWYAVNDIVLRGVVAPNDCTGKKVPEKLQVIARPGEFVFFVREETPMEKFRD